jgi:hypothetical protein
LVASTLTNGAFASFARRRAISVLPTPVGPIIRMFFGVTSARSSGELHAAPAVAQRDRDGALGGMWPMMCLSSSWTISRGVMLDMRPWLQLVRWSRGSRWLV